MISIANFLPPLTFNFQNSFPQTSSSLQEPTTLNVELLENHSYSWLRAHLLINVTSDISINVSYSFSGLGDSAELIPESNSSIFVISSNSSQIDVFIQPLWSVFPRTFQYEFTLFYINATTQTPQIVYNIPFGIFTIIMGIPLSIILGGILLIGIVIISSRSVKVRKKKGTQTIETSESISFSDTPALPATQIEGERIICPECGKNITEGSAFCQECGYHIPRFLRTKE